MKEILKIILALFLFLSLVVLFVIVMLLIYESQERVECERYKEDGHSVLMKDGECKITLGGKYYPASDEILQIKLLLEEDS